MATTKAFEPFADDTAAASFGELSVENGTGALVVSGSLEIRADAVGRERCLALARLFLSAAQAISDGAGKDPSPAATVEEIENPFG